MNGEFEKRLATSEENVSDIVADRIAELLNGDNGVILFGAGGGGINTLGFLRRHFGEAACRVKCFADNNPLKHGTVLGGIPVLSCGEAFRDYGGELVLVSCGEGDEIIRQLKDFGVDEERVYVPDVSVIDETDPAYIRSHMGEFSSLYEELADEKSRDVLVAVLNYKLEHDLRRIVEIADPPEDQYFDRGIVSFGKGDVFLDCGAYTGDTVEQYMAHNGGACQAVICIEADHDNCGIIREKALGREFACDCEVLELACWNERASLIFDKIGSGSGTLDAREDSGAEKVEVQADSIDHVLRGRRVSFIKMDIEGAEYKALLGAVNTIQRWRPALMISAYHRQSDLLRLSSLIKSMNEDYRLYLRHYRSMSVQETVLYAV